MDLETLAIVAAVLVPFGSGLYGLWVSSRAQREVDATNVALLKVSEQATASRFELEWVLRSDESARASRPPAAVEPPEPPAGLVQACAEGDCVLFLGSGVGAASGQPTWREALLEVLQECERGWPEQEWSDLVAEVGGEQYDLVADLLTGRLGRGPLLARLEGVLERRPGVAELPYGSLVDIPFAGALTNLWDESAVTWFRSRTPVLLPPETTTDFTEALREGRFFISPAYGSLRDGTSVLTGEAFEDYLTDHEPFARFLGSLYVSRTVFFVGTSLSGIEDLLRTSGLRGKTGRVHYALVATTPNEDSRLALRRERLRQRYNVELLPYLSTPGHPEVKRFLDTLHARVAGRPSPVKLGSAGREAPLSSVSLRNIGPFTELDIELADDWNILLGDNGTGKSTVLRAIALGLCGDDSRALAAGRRLLRNGAQSGEIKLTLGRTTLETRLVRERGRVRVIARQITPAQTGEWLVLGFPPVRGLSTVAASEHAALPDTRRIATIEDILPLVTGAVDTRFDDLSQWVRNELLRTDSGRETPSAVARVFSVLSRLGDGSDYRLDHVDEETLDVVVATPHGRVALPLLSQGTSSILSWTGTLVSRLEDLRRNAAREPSLAIVLVDELDAHLHPAWQRRIMRAVTDEFGNEIQIVATTHAPLVVGSMDRGKLWRFQSGDDTRVEVGELPIDVRGLRADQILVGPAFGTSSRDLDTERLIDAYEALALLDEPTQQQRAELARLAAELDIRLPSTAERERARQARALIEAAAEARIQALPEATRDKVLAELRLQVEEAITGSERPK